MLGEPGPFTRQVWFVCHGYGFLAGDFIKNFEALNEKEHLVVAPGRRGTVRANVQILKKKEVNHAN